MTTLREAAQQALEALEVLDRVVLGTRRAEEAITALRAALAEPVQEPVAEVFVRRDGVSFAFWLDVPPPAGTKLFTFPPQRKPLSEEEIYSLFRTAGSPTVFARAIERAHGIKE